MISADYMNTFMRITVPVLGAMLFICGFAARFAYHDNLDSWGFMIASFILLTTQLSVLEIEKEMKKYDFISARKAELEEDLKSCRKLIKEIESTIIEEEKELALLETKKNETNVYSE